MAEKLYTIPVNDAFDEKSECPVCSMRRKLTEDALNFTLGPSYMEDDVRMVTDRVGFCKEHVTEMYKRGNRLGLALMLKTHADKVIADMEGKQKRGFVKGGLFSKKKEAPDEAYLNKVTSTCFVCDKINDTFKRYVETTVILYSQDEDFRKKVASCKGFCNEHYSLLLSEARKKMTGKYREDFISDIDKAYLNGMKRVRDDLSWFIDKFDYRYANEPWKESKDSLQRMITKQNSTFINEGN